MTAVTWRTVRKPRPGDLADHKSGELDPRPVHHVDDDGVYLTFGSDEPYGPFPVSNYRYTREVVSA